MLDPFSVLEEGNEPSDDLQATIQHRDDGTLRRFGIAVVTTQVGLFALSLGLLLWWFRGQTVLGGALVAGGLLALGVTAIVYRRHRAA